MKVYRDSQDMSNYIKQNLEIIPSTSGKLFDIKFKTQIEKSSSPPSRGKPAKVRFVDRIKGFVAKIV